MPPSTIQDLIESNERLANATLAQAQAINKLTPVLDQLRRDVYDLKNDRETDVRNHQGSVDRINESLTRLLDVKDDIRELTREVTGTHMLPPPDMRSTAERMFDRLERASVQTKLWVFFLVLAALVGGWLHMIVAASGG